MKIKKKKKLIYLNKYFSILLNFGVRFLFVIAIVMKNMHKMHFNLNI